jgi:hypothetical protein
VIDAESGERSIGVDSVFGLFLCNDSVKPDQVYQLKAVEGAPFRDRWLTFTLFRQHLDRAQQQDGRVRVFSVQ